jgi:hypothetical protein
MDGNDLLASPRWKSLMRKDSAGRQSPTPDYWKYEGKTLSEAAGNRGGGPDTRLSRLVGAGRAPRRTASQRGAGRTT